MTRLAEPALRELAAKFADSDEDIESIQEHPLATVALQSAEKGLGFPLPQAHDSTHPDEPNVKHTHAANDAEGDEEAGFEEFEDDWDSEEEELASALEWADLRDGGSKMV
jgi:hypothetical protein